MHHSLKKSSTLALVFAAFVTTLPLVASAQSCGRVTVANMNWQSAEVLANIDDIILTEGYGCEVELVPGDTMPTLTAMIEKGKPDVAPEAWINAVRLPLDAAVKEGRLHYAARSLQDGGAEGWWIPKYVADANPGIKTIDDALKHPEIFPSAEAKGKGAVHNCPSGWNCQLTTGNAFKAWDAKAKGFLLVDTGSAAGLDGSIAKANERKQGWLGYYWAPTAILGKYPMVKLDAGVPFDKNAFETCNTKADCDHPTKTDWAKSEVFTVVTDKFKKTGSPALAYLNKRTWGNDTVNQLLSWMNENQATGADGARHFLKTQPELWTTWVSPEVAQKVKASL
ncbi:ABC transporter substrate-binding protein [Rhodoferax antarcticus]|uniref:ABC transporter substrate-binding protein n=1 Tax=Rhodoferax antarcticus TaxID=81479 RepID=UPI002225755A|nr:ABC transporter substrate-binding protein [Rhodoferax antarcticus]MCW2310799.1 glycine betaine/proline transport system substrate-binding protein [Rhodoferax antarcticus]